MARLASLIALGATAAQAAIPASEREVLQNLYIYTRGDSWSNHQIWNSPPGSECSWHGITCDAQGNTVVGIDLSHNNLSGTLPPLDGLTHLQRFNVDGHGPGPNWLVGSLPALSGLKELQYFNVAANSFSGPIPPLAGLSNLVYFDVSFNELSGPIPAFSGATSLAYFDARYNELTGSIPDLTGLDELDFFRVEANHLGGPLPTLVDHPKLYFFDAGGNHLTGSIPALTGLANLTTFVVGSNQLAGTIPSLSGLANLQYFEVGGNHLTGNVPDLDGLSRLRLFTINANQLTGDLPAPPASLARAYSALVCPNSLTPASEPPSAIDLAWNVATNSTPWSIKCSQTPQVTSIYLTSNQNPSVFGQPVTLTAAVYGANPTGTVTFTYSLPLHEGTTVLCDSVPVVDTFASCTTGAFAARSSDYVTASYSGDTNNAPSQSLILDQFVRAAVTEDASSDKPQVGQSVELVARVVGGGPSDAVTFYDGLEELCSNVSVTPAGNESVARCATTFDRVGPHSLSATDTGDSFVVDSIPRIANVTATQPFDADQSALTGSWYNVATSGQGLAIQAYQDYLGDGVALLGGGWFTYDDSGHQRWLFLQGGMHAAHGASFDLGVYESSGGNFDAGPVTSAVDYGSATLTFYDCSHATLAYSFLDGRSGTIAYTRLTGSYICSDNGVTFSTLPDSTAQELFSGNWFNPATSGQGLVVNIVPTQGAFVATWYTYAPKSEGLTGEASQRWFSIQSAYAGPLNLTGLPIYATQGGVFDDPAPIGYEQVGTADMNFTSCDTMTLHYVFTSGEFAGLSGTIAEQTAAPVPRCDAYSPP